MNKVGLLLLLLLLYPHRLVLLLLLLALLLHKVKSKDKSPEDPDDDHDEEEEIDFRIIGEAHAAVLKLVTFVSISDHKKVALEVLTTATQYSLCLCLS